MCLVGVLQTRSLISLCVPGAGGGGGGGRRRLTADTHSDYYYYLFIFEGGTADTQSD